MMLTCILKYYKKFITKNYLILIEKHCLCKVDSTQHRYDDATIISATRFKRSSFFLAHTLFLTVTWHIDLFFNYE